MDYGILERQSENSIPIWCVNKTTLADIVSGFPPEAAAWVRAHGYDGASGTHLAVPGENGELSAVLFGIGDDGADGLSALLPGLLPTKLPAGDYHFANGPDDGELMATAWALGAYRFDRFRSYPNSVPRLALPGAVDAERVRRVAEGMRLTRDLINRPANDLGPAELAEEIRELAGRHNADVDVISDGELIDRNFPLIHAVGAAAMPGRAPRLVDLTWGNPSDPKLTLVGKGVCFDTGGLDIKPASAMLLMKKDMGGAANILGLAHMIMDAGLSVRLRVIVPAVENAISGAAFRPGDIYRSRKGTSVEIGNTDAEGRLILADALALACEDDPDLVIDMATLTGAARVALGPDLSPFYTDDEDLADEISGAGRSVCDPVWRMPLWRPYDDLLKSKVADVNHISSGPFAGSVTAALFLARFVEPAQSWVHFDIYGWSPSPQPARPEGGAAQAIRALYHVAEKRYG